MKFSPAPGKTQEPRLKTKETRGSFPQAHEVFPSARENSGASPETKETRGGFLQAHEVSPSVREKPGALLKARKSAEIFPGARKLSQGLGRTSGRAAGFCRLGENLLREAAFFPPPAWTLQGCRETTSVRRQVSPVAGRFYSDGSPIR
jgi:hypothetical protein